VLIRLHSLTELLASTVDSQQGLNEHEEIPNNKPALRANRYTAYVWTAQKTKKKKQKN
jgi:hypothetical protein